MSGFSKAIIYVTSKGYEAVGFLLFFLMIFSPFTFNNVKMACLSILVLGVLVSAFFLKELLRMSRPVLLWYIAFLSHSFFFLVLGILYGNNLSYILQFSTVSFIWPFLFFVLTFYKVHNQYPIKLFAVIKFALFIISLYTIYRVISLLGYLPLFDIYPPDLSIDLDQSDMYVELSIPAATSMMFIAPAVVSFTLLKKDNKMLAVIIPAVISIVLIARRALLFDVVITPILTLFFGLFFFKKRHLKSLKAKSVKIYFVSFIIAAVIFTILANTGIFDFKDYFKMILEGFDFSGKQSNDLGASIRADQFYYLIQNWLERPFFGWGYGAVSPDIVRSYQTPYIYELTYVSLLFQTGIVGTVFYLSLIFWIYFKLFKLKSRMTLDQQKYSVAILVGLTTFLFANATNPYLYAFDHMWALFFPIIFINSIILHTNKLPVHAK